MVYVSRRRIAQLTVIAGICVGSTSMSQQVPPKFSLATRLVQLSVVAEGKAGAPVRDLAQRDFQIFDEGHEQKLAYFRVVNNQPSSTDTLDLPANVYTNLPGQSGTSAESVTIILADGINTGLIDQTWARHQILKYLGNIKPYQRVALYTLGTHLSVVHDFTSDASALVAALQRLGSTSPRELQQTAAPDAASILRPQGEQAPSVEEQRITALLTGFLHHVDATENTLRLDERVRITLAAFDAIARHVSDLPGRKNVIWVSGAFPILFGPVGGRDSRNYGADVETTTERLSSANVSVYPVDARGLIPEDAGLAQPMLSSRRQAVIPTLPPSLAPEEVLTMNTIAQNTGGRAFFNSNDVRGSIQRAVDDASFSYVLGYYPDHQEWNGEFRKVRVKVDRPHIQLHVRQGYYATPRASANITDSSHVLSRVAESALDSTGLMLSARIDRIATADGHSQIEARLNIDPHGITFSLVNGHRKARLIVAFVQFDAKGNVLTGGMDEQNVEMDLTSESYDRLMQTGLRLGKKLSLDRYVEQLCIVVVDGETNMAGSLHIPIVADVETQ